MSNSAKHIPSSEADSRSASQDVSRHLHNSMFNYRTHTISLFYPILSPKSSSHNLRPYFFNMVFSRRVSRQNDEKCIHRFVLHAA